MGLISCGVCIECYDCSKYKLWCHTDTGSQIGLVIGLAVGLTVSTAIIIVVVVLVLRRR